jgi:hypothetical protein
MEIHGMLRFMRRVLFVESRLLNYHIAYPGSGDPWSIKTRSAIDLGFIVTVIMNVLDLETLEI